MLRKTVWISALSLALLPTLATALPWQASWHWPWPCHYYVGVGVGPDTGQVNQHAHIQQLNNFNAFDHEQQGQLGAFASLFAGFRGYYRSFAGALEVNLNASTLKSHTSNIELIHSSFSHTSHRINNSYGISFLPGYQYTDYLLFYGRLGYANGHFRLSTTDTSLRSFSTRERGFRYGLGGEVSLPCHWATRFEWSHINYGSKTITTFDVTSRTLKTTRYRPRTNQFEFGLLYNFV